MTLRPASAMRARRLFFAALELIGVVGFGRPGECEESTPVRLADSPAVSFAATRCRVPVIGDEVNLTFRKGPNGMEVEEDLAGAAKTSKHKKANVNTMHGDAGTGSARASEKQYGRGE